MFDRLVTRTLYILESINDDDDDDDNDDDDDGGVDSDGN